MGSRSRPKSINKNQITFPISVKNAPDGQYAPKIEGVMSFNRAKDNDDKIDMTLHLLLKNKKEQRSHSVPRQNSAGKRFENDLRQIPTKLPSERRHKKDMPKESHRSHSSRRTWSNILDESTDHPASYVRTLSPPERDLHSKYSSKFNLDSDRRQKYAESNRDRYSEADDASSLTALNPVRTLQFLLGELQSIMKPKGEREQAVFRMIEEVVDRLPNSFTPEIGKRQPAASASDFAPTSSRDQISRTTYETLRKERDSLHQKLDEKSKTHLSLERKYATAEAKIVRLKAEREEMKENYAKLIEEQKMLIANLPSVSRHNSINKNLENHLENELKKAHMYINGLEKMNEKIQEKYKIKLRVIQDILNNGLDFQARENPRVTDVIGVSPLEDVDPLEYPSDSIKPPSSIHSITTTNKEVRAEVLSTSTAGLDAQKYIDKVMMNSGLLRSDQEHLFQSFVSIADQE